LKLNFDGATKANGCTSGGGVIRDEHGDLVAAYAGGLGKHSNNIVEAMALLWGLKVVISLGISHLHIQGDSKIILDAITGLSTCGWKLSDIISDIQTILHGIPNVSFSHTYREGNSVADGLANFGQEFQIWRVWRQISSIPGHIGMLIHKEKNSIIT